MGGFLEWAFLPERRVLTDGRNELFVDYQTRLAAARRDPESWQQFLDSYGVGIAYIDRQQLSAFPPSDWDVAAVDRAAAFAPAISPRAPPLDPDPVPLVEVVVAEARAEPLHDLGRQACLGGGDVHLHLPCVACAGMVVETASSESTNCSAASASDLAAPPTIDALRRRAGITSSSRCGVRKFWRTSSTAKSSRDGTCRSAGPRRAARAR